MKHILVILLIPWLLIGCAAPIPTDGFINKPWLIMSKSDWQYVPWPGDSVYELAVEDGKCYADTYSRRRAVLSEFETGEFFFDYGGHNRIARCKCSKGEVIEVEFVPWRLGTERLRAKLP